VTLDGEPYRYEANRSSPDEDVGLEGYVVGTRDRDRFVVPEGLEARSDRGPLGAATH